VYNVRKLHFQAKLCEVFVKDKKQHYCGHLVFKTGSFAVHEVQQNYYFIRVQTSYSFH